MLSSAQDKTSWKNDVSQVAQKLGSVTTAITALGQAADRGEFFPNGPIPITMK